MRRAGRGSSPVVIRRRSPLGQPAEYVLVVVPLPLLGRQRHGAAELHQAVVPLLESSPRNVQADRSRLGGGMPASCRPDDRRADRTPSTDRPSAHPRTSPRSHRAGSDSRPIKPGQENPVASSTSSPPRPGSGEPPPGVSARRSRSPAIADRQPQPLRAQHRIPAHQLHPNAHHLSENGRLPRGFGGPFESSIAHRNPPARRQGDFFRGPASANRRIPSAAGVPFEVALTRFRYSSATG